MTGQIIDFNHAVRQDAPRHTVDADDIRERLHADPRAFVEWMFSGRAFVGKNGVARIGDTSGAPGESLSIQLTGSDAGLWKDHATDEGGDLIALYRAYRGYHDRSNFVLSLKEIAREYLGDPVELERSAWQPTPVEYIAQKKAKLGDKPRADTLELGAPVATYNYFDTRGNIIAAVKRFEPDGTRESKTFRPYCHKTIEGVTKWMPGAPDLRPLYRLPDIALSQTVVLCEGEACADKLAEVGIPATSAMQGAKAPIDKTDWSPLAGKTVIVWPDNDAPGFAYAKAASERLAALGCKVLGITPPNDAPAKWDAADCVAEGRDAHVIISAAAPVATPQIKPRVRLVSISQLANLPPPTFLIDGTITVNGLSMLWGRSGSLKSFAALDKALCVATGLPWHGRAVKQGRVVYLAAEGASGLASRAMGWMNTRGRDCSEPDFQIIPHSLALATPDDLDAMITTLAEGNPISLIVIDTLSRTFGKGNPNQPADMNTFVDAVERLRTETGAHVMVIHHAGKAAENGEIGNEGLRNACDTIFFVKRNQNNLELINEAPRGKQKDFDELKPIKLQPVKVAFEQNGTERTTLILNASDEESDTGDDQMEDANITIGKNEKLIIDTLRKAGQPLGFTRLTIVTRMNKGSLTRALGTLVDKEIVKVDFDASGNTKQWSL